MIGSQKKAGVALAEMVKKRCKSEKVKKDATFQKLAFNPLSGNVLKAHRMQNASFGAIFWSGLSIAVSLWHGAWG